MEKGAPIEKLTVRKARSAAACWTIVAAGFGVSAAPRLMQPAGLAFWPTLVTFALSAFNAVNGWKIYNRIKQEEDNHER